MRIPYTEIALTVVFATLFFRIAVADRKSRTLWTSLSVLLSVASFLWLGWGILAQVGVQGGLFLCMFLGNMIRAKRNERADEGSAR